MKFDSIVIIVYVNVKLIAARVLTTRPLLK
jgi:hypothetical protein